MGLLCWIAGVCLAKGLLSTLVAILLPPWAWCIVVYNVLRFVGLA